MTIFYFFSLFLLSLINTSLTTQDQINQELQEYHNKVNKIYTDLLIKIINEEDSKTNIDDILKQIIFRLNQEAHENKISKIILERYAEINSDELLTAKINELTCVKNELSDFVRDQIDGRSPYLDFIDKIQGPKLNAIFTDYQNKYYKTYCSIFSTKLKNNDHILECFRMAVEEQIKRVENLKIKISQLKTDQKANSVSSQIDENNPLMLFDG